jgi:hypothetical protein
LDFDRAFVPELQGGLPAYQMPSGLSEPCHSPDRATPSYYITELELCTGISEVDVCVLQPRGLGGSYRSPR